MNLTMNLTKYTKQSGVTLVELMIAMGLGIFITSGAIQIYIGQKKSYSMAEELNTVQESGQFSLYYLSKVIQMAGYTDIDGATMPELFFQDSDDDCDTTDAWCTSDGGGANSDRLAVIVVPNDAVAANNVDCTNTVVAAGTEIVNVYDLKTVDGVSGLYCRGYNPDPAVVDWIADEELLVSGIDNLQFQFGTFDGTTYQYLPADEVTDWSIVQTVKIAILAASGSSQSVENRARAYALLDSTETTYTDTKLRRIYSTTSFINNSFL